MKTIQILLIFVIVWVLGMVSCLVIYQSTERDKTSSTIKIEYPLAVAIDNQEGPMKCVVKSDFDHVPSTLSLQVVEINCPDYFGGKLNSLAFIESSNYTRPMDPRRFPRKGDMVSVTRISFRKHSPFNRVVSEPTETLFFIVPD